MPLDGRRQCGCNCSNQAEWDPEGVSVPPALCSACSDNPCEYLAIFDRCDYECDGLMSSLLNRIFSTDTNDYGVIPLIKDECRFEDHCVWSYKDSLTALPTTVSTQRDKYIASLSGECVYRSGVPFWAKFFGVFGSLLNTLSGFIGAVPTFGCQGKNYVGAPATQPCGWYDYAGLTCVGWLAWEEWLADPGTFNRWELDISGTTATLTGTTDSGSTVSYSTNNWECPDDTANPPKRNTLTMTSYPDGIPGCKKFPKAVCIVPGYTQFLTPCNSVADMQACCDAGADEACFDVDFLDCSGGLSTTVSITTTRNVGLPAGVSAPAGVCGYFWGTADVDCTTSGKTSSFTAGLLVYCNGANWIVGQYCYSSGAWSAICTTTASLTSCCPNFRITWYCTGTTTCCCTPSTTVTTLCCATPVPKTLFATISAPAGGGGVVPACTAINGKVVTLTYNGATAWVGTFSAGTCGTLTVTFTVLELTNTPVGSCVETLSITDGSGNVCFSVADGRTLIGGCPLTSETFGTASWNASCTCCSTPRNNVSVTVTP